MSSKQLSEYINVQLRGLRAILKDPATIDDDWWCLAGKIRAYEDILKKLDVA